MDNICQRCNSNIDTYELFINNLVSINKLNIPFIDSVIGDYIFTKLYICEKCKIDFFRMMQYWWNTHVDNESDSTIMVKDFNTDERISLKEYRKRYDREK